jgi:hypothetical protein
LWLFDIALSDPDQLDPPVLLSAFGRRVITHWPPCSEARALHSIGLNPVEFDQRLPDRGRPLLGERLVELLGPDVVGVALDGDA